ncbi:pentapeptide repeat-containing protein [Streptomyces sp. NPDC089919]|uniref:pentapeptide repeat-containing protein n=1 Tax=Streptomyces sp. NPDC089919 TaxID=3155188 RepID=UPI0034197886
MTRIPRFGRLRRAAAGRRRPEGQRTGETGSRVSLLLLSLPGLAAVAALLFTWQQLGQSDRQLRINEQGQITTRYNAAISNLGAESMDVRLGGIYALERIMRDSPPDHGTVVSVLSAYVRRHAPLPATSGPPADVHAAMNVLVRRPAAADAGLEIDLSHTNLRGWKPAYSTGGESIHLNGALLTGSDLSGADLGAAELDGARLNEANLTGAKLISAHLDHADLLSAQLTGARFDDAHLAHAFICHPARPCGDLSGTSFAHADLTSAALTGADLRESTLCNDEYVTSVRRAPASAPAPPPGRCALLRLAFLDAADLSGLDLRGVDLSGASVDKAKLVGADLTDATDTGLDGADLTGVRGR